jgi:hypothetical protein
MAALAVAFLPSLMTMTTMMMAQRAPQRQLRCLPVVRTRVQRPVLM